MKGTQWLWLSVLSQQFTAPRAAENRCPQGTCPSASVFPNNFVSLLQKNIERANNLENPTCSLDVVLLLDISCSIKTQHWKEVQRASRTFISSLKNKDSRLASQSNVGALTFAGTPRWWSKLSNDFDSVADTVDGIDYNEEKFCLTEIDKGFVLAEEEFKTHSSKQKEQRIALVLTDGAPYSNVKGSDAKGDATKAAASLRNHARVSLIAVGLPGVVKTWEQYMKTLASQPTDNNYYGVETFYDITDTFIASLVEDLCKTSKPTPAPLSPAPKPAPAPTPTLKCEKDTRAPCGMGNACFQRTRGATFCDEGTETCHCRDPDECVVNVTMSTTRDGKWSVCRKPGEKRGEDSTITWMRDVVLDIVDSYATLVSNSAR